MLVLGIDGGGTNTRACIMDSFGNILGYGKSGASSVDTVPLSITKDNIESSSLSAIKMLDYPVEINAVFAGIGGIVNENDKFKVKNMIRKFPFISEKTIVNVDNDMKIAWAAGTMLNPGIALILGTGSVAYGYDGIAREKKCGGWGYVEGDYGSAYDLGISAVRTMIKAYDGRIENTPFTEQIFTAIGLKNINEITDLLYGQGLSRTKIASYAKFVTEYADKNDPHAIKIINDSSEEVKQLVNTVYKELFYDTKVDISIFGGLGNSSGYYKDTIIGKIKEISSSLKVYDSKHEAVIGAVLLAMKSVDIDTSFVINKLNNNLQNSQELFDQLYPMKLTKTASEKVWGGELLKSFFDSAKYRNKKIGELWEVSFIENSISKVKNGILSEKDLQSLIEKNAEKILGKRAIEKYKTTFPLLIKYLDINEQLSVQVHPNDDYAKENESSLGKAEIWYILDASDDAQLVMGLKNISSKDELSKIIQEDKIDQYFNIINVKKGDSIYIQPGLVHATYRGSILAYEIQENSNITYRIYDYNRLFNGKKRELHKEKAIDVIDINAKPLVVTNQIRRKEQIDGAFIEEISRNEYFYADKLIINGKCKDSRNDVFKIYSIIEGQGVLESNDYMETVKKGDTFLIPARLNLSLEGDFSLIKTWI